LQRDFSALDFCHRDAIPNFPRAEHLYARMGFTIKDETPLQRPMEYLSDPMSTSISNPGGGRE
jgi:hypothetical protein